MEDMLGRLNILKSLPIGTLKTSYETLDWLQVKIDALCNGEVSFYWNFLLLGQVKAQLQDSLEGLWACLLLEEADTINKVASQFVAKIQGANLQLGIRAQDTPIE